MKKIRIGILGCANIAIRSAIPAMIESENLEIVAVASRNENKEKMIMKNKIEYIIGYENLLKRDDIDAVYIPLPPSLHKEWCLKALDYGKHVLVEKPATTSRHDTENLIKRAEEKSLVLFENYMFEYHSQITFIKKFLEEGHIGEIKLLRSSFGFPMMDLKNFRYSEKMGGGVLLDAGGYPVKLATIFLGDDIDVISSNLIYSENLGVDIFGTATLKNKENKIAQISFGFDNYYQCNMEIWGTKGKITADRIFTAPPGYSPKIIVEKQNEKHEYTLGCDNQFIKLLEKFSNTIINEKVEINLNSILKQATLVEQIFVNSKGE